MSRQFVFPNINPVAANHEEMPPLSGVQQPQPPNAPLLPSRRLSDVARRAASEQTIPNLTVAPPLPFSERRKFLHVYTGNSPQHKNSSAQSITQIANQPVLPSAQPAQPNIKQIPGGQTRGLRY